MQNALLMMIFFLFLLMSACDMEVDLADLPEEYSDAIEEHVTQDSARHITEHEGIRVAVLDFYDNRDHRPAWIGLEEPQPRGDTLLAILKAAEREGPSHSTYDTDRLDQRLNEAYNGELDPESLARLDAEFTYGYLRYARDLHAGRVDPTSVNPEWDTNPDDIDLGEHLTRAVEEDRIGGSLQDITPQHEAYVALREALAKYRSIADDGGWPEVPDGPELSPGDTSADLALLRERLKVTGDLPADSVREPSSFDEDLADGLAHFQTRHGLGATGTLDSSTREALNVPVEDRLHLIEINLERWHWLPTELGERHVLVNLPDFKLYAYENGQRVDEMAVVIGEEYDDTATPVFVDEMNHLIFGPFWNVPKSIATDEILPAARQDIDYLEENNYEIVDRYGPDGSALEPSEELLDEVEEGNLFIREEPGPTNALGDVKFMFPNELAIYLHDTPEGELFEHDERGYSHGCVRVERPGDLAEFVLQDNDGWDRNRIDDAMAERDWKQVMLDETVPVYLLYFTAYADSETGLLHFSDDIYQHDDELTEALASAD